MRLFSGCAVWIGCVANLAAQLPQAVTPREARAEISKLQSKYAALADHRDRMVDLLAQHALGWSVSEATSMLVERVLDSTERDRVRDRIRTAERELASLHGEHRRLQQASPGYGDDVGDVASGDLAEPGWETVPAIESLPGAGTGAGSNAAALGAGAPGAAPMGESAGHSGNAAGESEASAVDREGSRDPEDGAFALVKGSEDHGAVGRLLFLAGRSLHRKGDQLAAEGRAQEATDFRGRARRKYTQGVRELRHASFGVNDSEGEGAEPEPATYPEDAEPVDMFHESKCLLGLFDLDAAEGALGLAVDVKEYNARIEAVRRPLLVITSRDVTLVEGTQQLGIWGTAAEALLDQLRWRMTQDGYQPTLPDISWREGTTR